MKPPKHLIPLTLAVLLGACAQLPMPSLPAMDVGSVMNHLRGPSDATQEQAAKTPAPGNKRAKAPEKSAPAPVVQAYTRDRAMLDLLDTNGRACAAASDTGTLGNLKMFATVSAELSKMALTQSMSTGDFNGALNDVKSKMQHLALQTLWLPMESEQLIGTALLKSDSVTSDARKNASPQLMAVKNEIQQALDDYTKLASAKYDSPYTFQILYMKGVELTMAMYPGGYLVVPENLLSFLAQMPAQERSMLIRYQMGHEVAHALRRHKTKWHQFRMVDAGFKTESMTSLLAANKGLISALNPQNVIKLFDVGNYVIKEGVKKHCELLDAVALLHERQELEADVCSVHMLSELARQDSRYAFSPVVAMDVYERSKKRAPQQAAKGKRAACSADMNHPDSAERRQNIAMFYDAVKRRAP